MCVVPVTVVGSNIYLGAGSFGLFQFAYYLCM